jgi:transcription elongation GreA/GreB family factor
VELELADGKKYKVTIVWAWEVSIDWWELRISLDSPIGSAIKGKKKWAIVSMRIGNERQDVKILSVA